MTESDPKKPRHAVKDHAEREKARSLEDTDPFLTEHLTVSEAIFPSSSRDEVTPTPTSNVSTVGIALSVRFLRVNATHIRTLTVIVTVWKVALLLAVALVGWSALLTLRRVWPMENHLLLSSMFWGSALLTLILDLSLLMKVYLMRLPSDREVFS
jgi:hypothetical protein